MDSDPLQLGLKTPSMAGGEVAADEFAIALDAFSASVER